MNSYLISSSEEAKRTSYIKNICDHEKIDRFDITEFTPDKILGISEVRELRKKLFLKPRGKKKAVIVNANYGITVTAQNALLKSLEEPPESTLIFLSVSSFGDIIPTIKSRCKNVELSRNISFSKEEVTESMKLIEEIKQSTLGKRLKIAQDLSKDKNELLNWMEKIILILREVSIKENGKELDSLKRVEKNYIIIKTTNVNHRLVLENLFLSLT